MMKKIGCVCPASPFDQDLPEENIKAFFRQFGINDIVFAPHTYKRDRFLSGPDKQRADDLNKFFADKTIDGIFALRGGYGSARILDYVDYDLIKQNPKPFFGFSDITALQLALLAKADLPSYSGITLWPDHPYILHATLKDTLENKPFCTKIDSFNHKELLPTKAKLIGGCLTLVESLIGTDYMPDFTDSFMVLEDVREEPYNLDRMFNHMKQAGVFNHIKALILGDFSTCVAADKNDGTTEEVLHDYFDQAPFPVFCNLFYGHGLDRLMLPIGKETEFKENTLYFYP